MTIVAALLAAWVTGAAIAAGAGATGATSGADAAVTVLTGLPALLLGLLVSRRRPASPAGPAMMAVVVAPTLTHGVEVWAATAGGPDPWWGAGAADALGIGIWVFNLAGFVALCSVFPDGRLPGRVWAAVPWLYLAAALLLVAVVAPLPEESDGLSPGQTAAVLSAFALLFATLLAAVASLAVRYRRGDELTRLQLRWLLAGVATVPLLLAAGWAAEAATGSAVGYLGFMFAIVVLLPAATAIGILRHDLLDLDRLLGGTAAWLLTTLVSAGVFALVVLGAARAGAASGVGVTAAAFVAALVLLPLHRRVHDLVARVVDRERAVTVEAVRRFVGRVRDGEAEPEEVEAVLRAALGDDRLRLLLTAPGSDELVDLAGAPAAPEPDAEAVPLTARGAEVAVLVLGRTSRRRLRLARELALEARLPIEVSRLRLALRGALDDARASRGRLVEAATQERRRLERDLHDGAQQRILAVGMRLRSAQRRLEPADPTWQDLDGAVAALEATVAELRRLAHGVRPSGLDDGLENAIRSLVGDSPVPVEVTVAPLPLSEAVATTAYFVVAEGLANAFKHAGASAVRVTVEGRAGGISVEVADDGRGGAKDAFGLRALRDRVAAIGGRVDVDSPAGRGTRITAVL